MNRGRFEGFMWGALFGVGAVAAVFLHWHFAFYPAAALFAAYYFRDRSEPNTTGH